MIKPCDRPNFLRPVKGLARVTLSDSFEIRPPSIYRAPGIARPSHQWGGLVGSEIQSFWAKGARVDIRMGRPIIQIRVDL